VEEAFERIQKKENESRGSESPRGARLLQWWSRGQGTEGKRIRLTAPVMASWLMQKMRKLLLGEVTGVIIRCDGKPNRKKSNKGGVGVRTTGEHIAIKL